MDNVQFDRDTNASEKIAYREKKLSLLARIMIGLGVKNHFQAQMTLLVISIIFISIAVYIITGQFTNFIITSKIVLTSKSDLSSIATSTNNR